MDRLDEVLATARPLLRQIDDVLVTVGAPPGHPVWAALRRVGLLPGDAAEAIAALHPATLAGTVPELRADARIYADVAADLPVATDWSGDAADAYEATRRREAGLLSGGPDSLDERLHATADLADALADWMQRTRDSATVALAGMLTSDDALLLGGAVTRLPEETEVLAAAHLATTLLRTVADNYALVEDFLRGSAALADPVVPARRLPQPRDG